MARRIARRDSRDNLAVVGVSTWRLRRPAGVMNGGQPGGGRATPLGSGCRARAAGGRRKQAGSTRIEGRQGGWRKPTEALAQRHGQRLGFLREARGCSGGGIASATPVRCRSRPARFFRYALDDGDRRRSIRCRSMSSAQAAVPLGGQHRVLDRRGRYSVWPGYSG